ncbi:MAG: rhodanese-like domain-containing protein, partial [Phycisphaerae bacterium]
MLFRMIYEDQLAHASYLIGCQKTGEAIVVDPRRDVDVYVTLAAKEGLRIVAVAETHVHADFVSGARELAHRVHARVYVSGAAGADWTPKWLADSQGQGASGTAQVLQDRDEFSIGKIRFLAVHTPGHTPEHVCYLVTDAGGGAQEAMGILSGDFVFVGDLGRPDLLEKAVGVRGAGELAAHSLRESAEKFLTLADYLQVWPAHGAGSACGKSLGAVPQSTVGYERRQNSALQLAGDASAFVRAILADQPEPPSYFARMKRVNVEGPALLGELPPASKLSTSEAKSAIGQNAQVVDLRSWNAFRAGHIPNAICAPFDKSFTTIVGSYANPGVYVILCSDQAATLDDAVRCCVRVGIDRIIGSISTDDLASLPSSTTAEVDVQELKKRMDSGYTILDVRREDEFVAGHMPGAKNIAHVQLANRLEELSRDKPLLVSCRSGARS